MKINTPCSVYEKYPSQQHETPLDKIKLNSYIFSTTSTFYTHCYVIFFIFRYKYSYVGESTTVVAEQQAYDKLPSELSRVCFVFRRH